MEGIDMKGVEVVVCFFFSSRRRHTRWNCDWSSDVCSSDLKRFPRVEADCLIPIPLHKSRLRWRGFNQAELIARELSLLWNIPVRTDLLIRQKSTSPQADIKNRDDRIKNATGIFAPHLVVKPLSGTVILID